MGTRFQRGTQATVIAQPQQEILPGLDRPTAVLFLGGGLWLVNNVVGGGFVYNIFATSFGRASAGASSTGDLPRAALELGLVAFLYILAKISDEAGSVAILLLIALWVVWLILHVNKLSPSGAGTAASTATKQG